MSSASSPNVSRAIRRTNVDLSLAFYGFETAQTSSSGRLRPWQSLNVEDPDCGKAAALCRERPATISREITGAPICVLKPPHCTKQTVDVIIALEGILDDAGLEVAVEEWPPSVAHVEGKFVISLLDNEASFLGSIDAAGFEVLREVALQGRRLLWVCSGDDPHMAIALGWLRVLQNENANRVYQHLTLTRKKAAAPQSRSCAIARLALTQTREGEYAEEDGNLYIPRWYHEESLSRMLEGREMSVQLERAPLGVAKSSRPCASCTERMQNLRASCPTLHPSRVWRRMRLRSKCSMSSLPTSTSVQPGTLLVERAAA